MTVTLLLNNIYRLFMSMFNGIVGSPLGMFTIFFMLIISLFYVVRKLITR